jgi:hypothetical protein
MTTDDKQSLSDNLIADIGYPVFLKTRKDSIEITIVRPGDGWKGRIPITCTVEDESRVYEGLLWMYRRYLSPWLCSPQGVNYQAVKPTTGGIKIIYKYPYEDSGREFKIATSRTSRLPFNTSDYFIGIIQIPPP